ncbi:MAG: lipid-A-disaccharide synthase [Betaproteobacteria bacterium]|nr:lipid-A-disaccharide synthase [Betaproteobacteria bacterium]
MSTGLAVGMVAGEASGDYLGAHLILALRERFPHVQVVGIGGPKMESAGMQSWFPMEKLAVRGYVEVFRHYREITGIRRKLAGMMGSLRPRIFIGIDAPDFNLPLEARLKHQGIATAHYASPSIWAWRRGRLRSIGAAVSHMLVLFPFEEPLYRRAGIPVTFVGHPLADEIPMEDSTQAMRDQLRLPRDRKYVAMLPGSRQSELQYMAGTFVKTARILHEMNRELTFLVPLVSRETREIFEAALYSTESSDLPVTILFGHAREAIAAADAVLVASGTATLEAALYRKPMVITYKMADLTWKLMSRMRYQPWVGLPNIISGEFVVPELLQQDATPENLAQALYNILTDPAVRDRLPKRLASIHAMLRQDTAARAADALMHWLSS